MSTARLREFVARRRLLHGGASGYSFVEVLIVVTIVLILASAVQPLAKIAITRQKESELRRVLREMRTAIDKYKDAADAQKFQIKVGTEGYPESLEQLVEGVLMSGSADGSKIKFLRRIPIDPMTGKPEWGLRSMQDDPKSQSWGGENVFDVYTKTMDRARDGTPYSEW